MRRRGVAHGELHGLNVMDFARANVPDRRIGTFPHTGDVVTEAESTGARADQKTLISRVFSGFSGDCGLRAMTRGTGCVAALVV